MVDKNIFRKIKKSIDIMGRVWYIIITEGDKTLDSLHRRKGWPIMMFAIYEKYKGVGSRFHRMNAAHFTFCSIDDAKATKMYLESLSSKFDYKIMEVEI